MIPAHDGTLSEFGAREGASARDCPVTHAQFVRYREAGLLGESNEAGRWPPTVVERLISIKALDASVRSLDRRAIYLNDERDFPIAPEKLRTAMVNVVPTIRRPVQKLRLVARDGRSPAARNLRAVAVPPPGEWVRILRHAALDLFAALVPGWYAMARTVIPSLYADRPNPLADIPFEEQIVLYAIIDLSQRLPPSRSTGT